MVVPCLSSSHSQLACEMTHAHFNTSWVCGTVWEGVVISPLNVMSPHVVKPSGPRGFFVGTLFMMTQLPRLLSLGFLLHTSGLGHWTCLGIHSFLKLNSLLANNCSLSSLTAFCITEVLVAMCLFLLIFFCIFFSFLFLAYFFFSKKHQKPTFVDQFLLFFSFLFWLSLWSSLFSSSYKSQAPFIF